MTDVRKLTEVLHILICEQSERGALLASSGTGSVALVDDDAVGHGRSHESGAIGELCPSRVVVEGDVGKAVAQGAEEQREVASEPCELQRLRQ